MVYFPVGLPFISNLCDLMSSKNCQPCSLYILVQSQHIIEVVQEVDDECQFMLVQIVNMLQYIIVIQTNFIETTSPQESNQESSLHTTTMEFQFSMIIDQEAEKCLDESLSEKSTSIKLNNQKLNQYVYQFIQEHAFITSEDRAKSKINCIDAIQLLFQLSIRSKFKDSFKYALNLFTGIDCSQEAFNIKLRLKQLILSYASSIQNQNTIFDVIINTALAIKNEPNGSILAFLLCIATMNIFSYYDFGQVVSGYTDDQKQQLFCIGKIVEAALCTNWVLE
ncbi:Conserved_hypothetical protein [Hexamita inflata]|uniref:Uncharacterized protein n=1 Tax=Hexamita inflata TaxID=28002 RepID=A0AA86Q6N4_9EUKA|nr:Conserved hypothetical protein [Hexamita inflata]